LFAQGSALLSVAPPEKIVVKRDAPAEARLRVSLQPGYHVNSNTPSEDYLIPLKLTWAPGGLEPGAVVYPKPQLEKYEFSPKPISVLTGNFELACKFKTAPGASAGPGILTGKLRYQACNSKACFPPKTVEIKLPYQIQ
jgi:hypothetical protein